MSLTSQEIVDYVMFTPGNTNPIILKELIDNTAGSEPTEQANCLYINNLDALSYHFIYAENWDDLIVKLGEATPGYTVHGGDAEGGKIQCLIATDPEQNVSLQRADNSITSYEPTWTVVNTTSDVLSNCKIFKWLIG